MLPTSSSHASSNSLIPEYFYRMCNYTQMDLEYTFFQMFYLCVSPTRAYRTTKYHKQTKNQWARDDPGFAVILGLFMTVASFAYAIAFQDEGFFRILYIICSVVLIDFVLVGCVIATIGWFIANKFMLIKTPHGVDQRVEWLYSFDVHCNSFFPLFLVLYVLQYFLIPLLMTQNFVSTVLANSLYSLAFSYYFYITFLGYEGLPFLENAVWFLYPVALIMLVYLLSTLLNYNLCLIVLNIYFGK
eukprot:TRINITY_DN9092_c0_g1_i1.p1 TRINITY_DN9092_c0_g1~~TRINITY_DN9092_c0_g1_i1.p1  ORF type:complete len:244 (+),score=53.97 TRINITY_DN9092_c0_g1_i1:300-1031(+)